MSQNVGKKVIGGQVNRKDSMKGNNETENMRNVKKKLTFGSSNKQKRLPVKSNTKVMVKQEDSVDSVDSDQALELTKRMKIRILDSMTNFKAATKNFISENTDLVNELSNFQGDLYQVKSNIFEILSESSATNSKLQEKKILRDFSEKQKEYNEKLSQNYSLSLETDLKNRESLKNLNEKVRKLKNEVSKLKEHMNNTEEKITEVEEENTELKMLTTKLQLYSELPIERKNCSACFVF